jgi:Flp pilus assembly protein TadG
MGYAAHDGKICTTLSIAASSQAPGFSGQTIHTFDLRGKAMSDTFFTSGLLRRDPLREREGVAAVEAAFVLPIVVTLMLGVWEVGRMIEVTQMVSNAAREGARVAAGGSNGGNSVTVSTVQQAVRDYMTAAGLPAAAVSGAQITLTNLSAHSWTNPVDAQPLDKFSVKVVIPAGSAFDSLRWSMVNKITGLTQVSALVTWMSTNNSQVTVSATLPL